MIGGRSIAVTERIRLDEADGPLVVGACVEVEYEKGVVNEIETEDDPGKCGKLSACGFRPRRILRQSSRSHAGMMTCQSGLGQ